MVKANPRELIVLKKPDLLKKLEAAKTELATVRCCAGLKGSLSSPPTAGA